MFGFPSNGSSGCANTPTTTKTFGNSTSQGLLGPCGIARESATMAPACAAPAQSANAPVLKRKSRDDEHPALPLSPTTDFDLPANIAQPSKRFKSPSPFSSFSLAKPSMTKRDSGIETPPTPPLNATRPRDAATDNSRMAQVEDIIQYQFSHEILLKHNEVRCIEQEIAKCQIALEQLRRCHLIPYPVSVPTPQQMLDMASGLGSTLSSSSKPDAAVPKWAAPFGVTDGPYARHYAKWLIPDPAFDGYPLPAASASAPTAEAGHLRSASSMDTRSTRNSGVASLVADPAKTHRRARGSVGQLPKGPERAQPTVRSSSSSGIIIRRSDGMVVKLVCTVCKRSNFSNPQGFINHCRISHKLVLDTHDAAAMLCGSPLGPDEPVPPVVLESVKGLNERFATSSVSAPAAPRPAKAAPPPPPVKLPPPPPPPGSVHPLVGLDPGTAVTLERMEATNNAYCQAARGRRNSASSVSRSGGRFQGRAKSRSQRTPPAADTEAHRQAPHLTILLEDRDFSGDIAAAVNDAKADSGLDDVDFFDEEDDCPEPDEAPPKLARPACAMRAPVSASAQSVDPATSLDGIAGNAASRAVGDDSEGPGSPLSMYDDDIESMDLSPQPLSGNNAPSLVSDDGDYGSSDEGSESDSADVDMEVDGVESLASLDDVDDVDHGESGDESSAGVQPIHHRRGGVKVRSDGSKHVTFASPVKGTAKAKNLK